MARYKFICQSAGECKATDQSGKDVKGYEMILRAVPGKPQDFEVSETPTGRLSFQTLTDQHFEAGKEYDVDINPAD